MNKPDWNDAPEWAQWLAMDDDGQWWWYDKRPELLHGQWSMEGDKLEFAGESPITWQGTLEERPND